MQCIKSCRYRSGASVNVHIRISKECFHHLVKSVPQRVEAVLRAKGDSIQYYYSVPDKVLIEAILRLKIRQNKAKNIANEVRHFWLILRFASEIRKCHLSSKQLLKASSYFLLERKNKILSLITGLKRLLKQTYFVVHIPALWYNLKFWDY